MARFRARSRWPADEVVFRVQADATSGRKRAVRLAGDEFIKRFLIHVQPTGFKRIRHYGRLAPAHKARRLALARAALDAPAPDAAVIDSLAQFLQRVARIECNACPYRGAGHFAVFETLAPLRASKTSARGPP
ncbi:MAG: transposase [Gammaproteobacteria bacterium]|nr:transposase [Gammaproteobacteria bacterium]MBK9467385.1 transposase [Gammaproteobacteria bacterium]MBP6482146.1 transposase [Pseudomonadales bacterium]MBP7910254.1 transposase [Pseudomonadales bacterium]